MKIQVQRLRRLFDQRVLIPFEIRSKLSVTQKELNILIAVAFLNRDGSYPGRSAIARFMAEPYRKIDPEKFIESSSFALELDDLKQRGHLKEHQEKFAITSTGSLILLTIEELLKKSKIQFQKT